MNPTLRKLIVRASGGRFGRRLLAEAHAARDRSDWVEAEQLYRATLARKPALRFIQIELGDVVRRSGRSRDALALWFEYLRHPHTGRDPHVDLLAADLLAESGNPGAAAFHYDRASAEIGRRRPSPDAAGGVGPDGAMVALAACETNLPDLERLTDCAATLSALGHVDEAGLLLIVADIRRGWPRASSFDTLAEVGRDLAALQAASADTLAPDPGAFVSVPPARSPGSAAATFAPDRVFDESEAVAAALRYGLSIDGTAADLDRELFGLRDRMVDSPPLASLGPDESVRQRAGRVAWNSLRDFLLRHRFLSYEPTGSGAVLRASACFSRAGLGPYLDGAARLIGRGADVFGWLQIALATPEQPLSREALERGAIMLGGHLPPLPTNDFVEELGDLGLVRAVGGIFSHRLACGSGTRLLIERVRDAFLDAGIPTLAAQTQGVLAADWRDDPVEQTILADLQAMAAHGIGTADLQALEQRFARDTRRRSLRMARKARAADGTLEFSAEASDLAVSVGARDLAPEIALAVPDLVELTAGVEILHLGWRKSHSPWGPIATLRGIEAVRLRCVSWDPATGCELFLDGTRIARVRKPEPVGGQDGADRPYQRVFNVWIDLSATPTGPHVLDIACMDEAGNRMSAKQQRIMVEAPEASEATSLSDAVVVLPDGGEGALEDRVNALPSVVRPAARSFFGDVIERVLVVRADQLGDFVASIPAMRRLAEMLPEAKLYALVTPANEALARSLGLFVEVITAELIYSHVTRRRHMSIDRQTVLRDRLHALRLDLAIDLSPGSDSRPLLRLSGALHLVGFRSAEFPWLSFGVDVRTHDRANGKERASHATVVLALVESLAAALSPHGATLAAAGIDRQRLGRFRLDGPHGFAVLHAGARIDFKRWPLDSYIALAGLIVERSDLNVVLISDDAGDGARVRAAGVPPGRLDFVGGNLPFDEFEALIGFCDVFVGNDTGPKHLAALRGAKVVSVHMGQVNWDEWGQEDQGLIVSRRVPCCGCGIDKTADCGKDLACLTNIRPDEVFAAVQQVLGRG